MSYEKYMFYEVVSWGPASYSLLNFMFHRILKFYRLCVVGKTKKTYIFITIKNIEIKKYIAMEGKILKPTEENPKNVDKMADKGRKLSKRSVDRQIGILYTGITKIQEI